MIGSLPNHSFIVPAAGYGRVDGPRQAGGLDAAAETAGQVGLIQQAGDRQQLSADQKQQVHQLKQRDHEVRAHERAHLAAGAGLVQGGARFTFQRGPDGRMYAVGGEVKIDTSAESDPDQTIRKMQQVRRAALAPAEPSGADQSVAAQASQIEAQARLDKRKREHADNPTEKADDHQGLQAPGASPGRQPYSAEVVGQTLNIAV